MSRHWLDRGTWIALIICALLTVLFYGLSISAIATKSATVDEPMHFAAAWAHVYLHDFHVNPEDPPLWNRLAMLPIARGDLDFEATRDVWQRSLTDQNEASHWVHDILQELESREVKMPALIDRSRRAMAV